LKALDEQSRSGRRIARIPNASGWRRVEKPLKEIQVIGS
jgi:hypothetical protein